MEISRHLKQTHTKVYRARNSIRRMACEKYLIKDRTKCEKILEFFN